MKIDREKAYWFSWGMLTATAFMVIAAFIDLWMGK